MLAPAALSWALTMHRLFASLTGDGEEMPRSHAQAIVFTPNRSHLTTDEIMRNR